ncbi:24681_t:CDS:2 [Gigaspora rosea]|nr:24681_t:CDS:2 [Gigaspora rosea]
MIPHQSRQISFCDEFDRTSEKIPTPGRARAVFSIPLVYPYLKDQIIGPDYRIIQCDKIDSLGSWQDQWCSHHQRLALCKVGYKISKLWVIYQYQYRKGLFLTWLKEQREKSRQQQIEPATAKNVKNDMVNKEINTVEIVATG